MDPTSSKQKKIKEHKRPKSSPGHPPYLKMITEAIVALKERTGSSQYAIAKFIEEKHKDHLPANFKRVLLFQLKKCVADEKLVKIKASFKVPSLKSSISKPSKAVAVPSPSKAVAVPSPSKAVAVPSPSKKLAKPNPAAKSKTKVASKPKAKVASQPKAKVGTKPKARLVSKPKIVAKPKPKVTGLKPKALPKSKAATKSKSAVKSRKVAKTSAKPSPGKKVTKPALPKKLKTLKSPVKKALPAKRTKKTTK